MSDTSPTGHAIYAVVRASLRLVSSSSELLTAPELVALEEDIYATLAVIRGQIQSEETGDGRARVDMTAWSDSDEEKEVEKEVGMVGTSTAGAGGGAGGNELLPIPTPYPFSPPEMDELPEYWYVVVRGTEVGIFTGMEFSARAATGVTHHLYRVGTWAKAAALYNELYRTNGIVRVST